jgi:hypothetical protein
MSDQTGPFIPSQSELEVEVEVEVYRSEAEVKLRRATSDNVGLLVDEGQVNSSERRTVD